MLQFMCDIVIHMRLDEENVKPTNALRSTKLKASLLTSLPASSCHSMLDSFIVSLSARHPIMHSNKWASSKACPRACGMNLWDSSSESVKSIVLYQLGGGPRTHFQRS